MYKSNKGLKVLVVILILLVLGLAGYLVYDKVISKEEVKPTKVIEKKKEKDVSIDINSELATSLVELTRQYGYGEAKNFIPYSDSSEEVTLKAGIDESLKFMLLFNNLKIENYLISPENLDNAGTGGAMINDAGVSLLKTQYEELFGYDGLVETERGCPSLKIRDGKYYAVRGCGDMGLLTNKLYPTKAYYDNKDVIIEGKVVFMENGDEIAKTIISRNPVSWYSMPVLETSIEVLSESQNYSGDIDFDKEMSEVAEQNMDKLNTYIHRFKKHNGKYYLYSVKKAS